VLEGQVCADPDDDKCLACALASGAGIIVSGDKHLVDVSGYRGIEVLRPRAFVDRYLAG
jgi:predicted nucleic acid-binding protein